MAIFQPTDISGCHLWLKASAIGISNNQAVQYWIDSSGSGNHMNTVVSGGGYPRYLTNQLNGLPVVRFTGIFPAIYFQRTNATADTSLRIDSNNLTSFVVFNTTSYSGKQVIYSRFGIGNNYYVGLNDTAIPASSWFFGDASPPQIRTSGTSFGLGSNQWFLRNDYFNTGSGLYTINRNNTLIATGVATGAGVAAETFYVGADTTSTSKWGFTGDLAEIILYGRRLSIPEINNVNSYLEQTYNIFGQVACSLYTLSTDSSTGTVPLYTSAFDSVTSGDSLYIRGLGTVESGFRLYTQASTPISTGRTLFITSNINSGMSLYIFGATAPTSGVTSLYVGASTPISSSTRLYTVSSPIASGIMPLFLKQLPPSTGHSSTTLFVSAPITPGASNISKSTTLYMDSFGVGATLPMFLKNVESPTTPNYMPMYLKTVELINTAYSNDVVTMFVENNTRETGRRVKLFISGDGVMDGASVIDSHMNLFIKQKPGDSKNVDLYMKSHSSGNSHFTLYTKGVFNYSNSTTLMITGRGATGVFPLYLKTGESSSSGLRLYTSGKPEISSGINTYTYGF